MARLVYKRRLVYCLLLGIVVLAACRGRNGGESVPSEPEPTVTPIVEVTVIETFTPTPPPPVPTATETPTVAPTVTPSIAPAKTNVQANLRGGPGVAYELVGFLEEGTEITPVSRSADRLWLKLEDEIWIFAYLVADAPSNLPLETNIPVPPLPPATATSPAPTKVPATPTPTPTATPVPVLGDWSLPVHRNQSFVMPDGLEITLREVIYGDDERMQTYIERRGGQSCEGCLAIELQVVNKDGNSREYVVLEDFKLFNGSPDSEPYEQVRCRHASGLRSMENQGALRALVKGFSGGGERFVCFEGVESLSLNTRLVYSPVFLWEDPNTPTATPEKSSVVYASEPIEKEQTYRTGWSIYFTLLGI